MTRRSSILFLALFLLIGTPGPLEADKPKKVPMGPPVRPTDPGKVQFTVELPDAALRVNATLIEGQGQLTMSSVDLDLDEPVFHSTAPGEPRLPRLRRLVALPRHAILRDVSVQNLDPVTIDNVPLVEWAQPARPGQGGPKQRPPIPPELTIIGNEIVFFSGGDALPPTADYLQKQVWPSKTASSAGKLGGEAVNVVQIDIAPVEWRPGDQQIVFYTKQVLDVRYELPRSQPRFKPRFADHAIASDLRNQVVNPDLVPVYPLPFIQKIDAPYLIITDNIEWNEDMTPGAPLDGDLVAEFQRLADWKTQKGVRAKVVTVSDIVGGRYGSFAEEALDLQEAIREFLKHARNRWNTYWVLLGGAQEIIPPRVVLASGYANARHAFLLKAEEQPSMGRAHWHAATSTIRVHADWIEPGMTIYSMRDDTEFQQVGWPSGRIPGWAYATDDTYRSPSILPTEFVVVRGAAGTVENTDLYLDLAENRVATDLYYASVDDPLYDVPGQRDWDANGNGKYGQTSHTGTVDGVSFDPDLSVGRVLARNGDEAARWVDRTLAYEKYDQDPGFADRLVLLGDNWGATGEPATHVFQWERLTVGKYHLFRNGTDNGRANIYFRGSVLNGHDWILVSMKSSGHITIPYNRSASLTSTGYFYCTDETFTTRSETPVTFLGITIYLPVATRFVTVFAPYDDIETSEFFFDNFSPDGVIGHKERQAIAIASSAPAITDVARAYTDWFDFPGGPDPALELTSHRAEFLLERGNNIVSVAGHGAPSGVAKLTNWMSLSVFGDDSGVFYADSCQTAEYTRPSRSIAGHLQTRSRVGVSAYLGNTAYSWIGQGADFEEAFWRELRRNDSLIALHHTKARFQGWNTEIWTNYAMHLFGDPELRVWRDDPLPLDLEVPDTISPGDSLRARVVTPSGSPIPFTRVALTGSRIHEVELTDLGGFVEFRSVLSPGTFKVTTTPSGYLPQVEEVRVAP